MLIICTIIKQASRCVLLRQYVTWQPFCKKLPKNYIAWRKNDYLLSINHCIGVCVSLCLCLSMCARVHLSVRLRPAPILPPSPSFKPTISQCSVNSFLKLNPPHAPHNFFIFLKHNLFKEALLVLTFDCLLTALF